MSIPQSGSFLFGIPSEEQNLDLGVTYLFDFEKGDFVYENGAPVEVTGVEAIKVWVSKILRTEKYRFTVYEGADFDYGVTLEDYLVGNKYPLPFVESEIKRQITEAVLQHPRIQFLSDWHLSREDDELIVAFRINLIGGESVQWGEVLKSG